MKRLRHPIRAIREPFGKAGLTVAIFALVMAMVGGAWAAAGLNGKQKKEVKTIAKSFQGAGPAGPAGAAGAAGPVGPVGPAGADGTNGTNGTNGAAGAKGATGGTGTNGTNGTNGPTGGTGANGTNGTNGTNGATGPTGPTGSPFVAGTAPSGAILKGTWALPYYNASAAGEAVYADISTSIPVANNVGVWRKLVKDPEFMALPSGKTLTGVWAFGQVLLAEGRPPSRSPSRSRSTAKIAKILSF